MMGPAVDGGQRRISGVGIAPAYATAQPDDSTFGAVMAQVDGQQALAAVAASVPTQRLRGAALDALARQLDHIGRQRLEAQRSSGELAGAWASGMDAETLAVTMHRQAGALAEYNIGVMMASKLVGVTTGALKQLTASG